MTHKDSLNSQPFERLLPQKIDLIASETPQKIHTLWPVNPFSYEAGFRTITYADLANAVNGLSWWIDKQLGPSTVGEVLAYMGPTDVRYIALLLAATKTGYVLFVTSPRNSAAAHRSLFESLQCQTLLTTEPKPPPVELILKAVGPKLLAIPNLAELLEQVHPIYSYNKTFEEGREDGLLVVHTSGSTGMPKPLMWTLEAAARHQDLTYQNAPVGLQSVEGLCRGKHVMVTLPPFHGGGIIQYLMTALALDTVVVSPAARGIATGQGVVEALKQTPADVALLVPSIVAELAQDPELLRTCAQYLKLILYMGGDLPQAIGDKVASVIPLRCVWGASEVGVPQQLINPELGPMDWKYIQFHPSLGAEFQDVGDGLHELVIPRRDELSKFQTTFSIRNLADLKEYRSRDYFRKHPTVFDAWSWVARADDIIVLLNGEKINPISMEGQILAKNHELSGAIVFGSQRLQAGLLIEPNDAANISSTAEKAALIERIWPSVEEANRLNPAHGRIEKAFIIVTTTGRPMIRAGKGTVQKQATFAAYAAEIDHAYADAEIASSNDGGGETAENLGVDATVTLLHNTVQSVMEWPALVNSDNFFDLGLDSLQALRIIRALRRALRRPTLAISMIYKNPTISLLAAAILGQSDLPGDDMDMMSSLLSTYTALIQQIPKPSSFIARPDGPFDVLLTGSTGYIGTYLLHSLLTRLDIRHVFCLNRRDADSARAVQLERFASAGLLGSELENRVTFIKAELSHPRLGLSDDIYKMLQSRAELVVHNAWPVNFSLELTSFRPHLAGVVNLCALSATSGRTIPIIFMSSVTAMGSQPAPEVILKPLSTPHPNGYARSKFLAELLFNEASGYLGIPTTIARVGQVAGPVQQKGLWNPREWLPSLIRSSMFLGCLPDSLGAQFSEVDWIPSDVLAEVIMDIAANSQANSQSISAAQVYNLRNPNTISWKELLPTVQAATQERCGRAVEIVIPSTWIERLRRSMTTIPINGDISGLAKAAEDNPGIKLFEFYRDNLWAAATYPSPMDIDRALKASPALQALPAVSTAWMRKWMDEWNA